MKTTILHNSRDGKDIYHINGNPFFWPVLKLFFPAIDYRTTIVTWGNRVYCRNKMTTDLWAHEIVHCQQQGYSLIKGLVFIVWYMLSKQFRFDMELEAYQEQYRFVSRQDAKKAPACLSMIAADLSGPMYGNLVSFDEAVKLIKQW